MVPDTVIEPGPGALSAYYEWFDSADTGSVLCYHFGDLHYDRDPDIHRGVDSEKRREIDALNTLANRVLADAREGCLQLFQRKHGESLYEYLAVLRRKPSAPALAIPKELRHERSLVRA
jgi:hypothetical protein